MKSDQLQLQPPGTLRNVVLRRLPDDPAHILGGANCLPRGIVSTLKMRPVSPVLIPVELFIY
jgi:hypothetical protein